MAAFRRVRGRPVAQLGAQLAANGHRHPATSSLTKPHNSSSNGTSSHVWQYPATLCDRLILKQVHRSPFWVPSHSAASGAAHAKPSLFPAPPAHRCELTLSPASGQRCAIPIGRPSRYGGLDQDHRAPARPRRCAGAGRAPAASSTRRDTGRPPAPRRSPSRRICVSRPLPGLCRLSLTLTGCELFRTRRTGGSRRAARQRTQAGDNADSGGSHTLASRLPSLGSLLRGLPALDSPVEVSQLDVADQLDHVPGYDPVARYGALCLRILAPQPVLQAPLEGVIGG